MQGNVSQLCAGSFQGHLTRVIRGGSWYASTGCRAGDSYGFEQFGQELERRGWRTKQWTTRKGQMRGGKTFTKTSLHKVLTNIAYIGKVRYKDEVHFGEHPALIDEGVWQRVQVLLRRNGRTGGALVRNQFGSLLKGLLRCVGCDCAMTPSSTVRNGSKRYRYYTCTAAQKKGWETCVFPSMPAGEIERFVDGQIRCIGRDPALLGETLAVAGVNKMSAAMSWPRGVAS
jgi:site-specific DNA recombinase